MAVPGEGCGGRILAGKNRVQEACVAKIPARLFLEAVETSGNGFGGCSKLILLCNCCNDVSFYLFLYLSDLIVSMTKGKAIGVEIKVAEGEATIDFSLLIHQVSWASIAHVLGEFLDLSETMVESKHGAVAVVPGNLCHWLEMLLAAVLHLELLLIILSTPRFDKKECAGSVWGKV